MTIITPIRLFTIGFATFLLAVHSSTAQSPGALLDLAPLLERHAGRSPELRKPSSATPGGVVYEEFDYPVRLNAIPAERIPYGEGVTLAADVPLVGYVVVSNGSRKQDGAWVFCGDKKTPPFNPPGLVCVADLDADGKFDQKVIASDTALFFSRLGFKKKLSLPHPVAYEVVKETVSTEAAEHWEGDFVRRELVYQGAGGGILRLMYREYKNDMARPAFSQELTYDLATEGVTLVSFQDSRIEVRSAGNSGIEYTVLSGF